MSRCRNGHDSATDDYCEVCGVPMTAGGGTATAPPAAGEAPTTVTTCGNCDQPMHDGGRFCERCGWDAEVASLGGDPSAASPPPSAPPASPPASVPSPPVEWHVVAVADREFFDTVMAMEGEDATGLTFPAYWPERHILLDGDRILIGRHSRSRGVTPDIDLGGQFTDPGVSHLHAVLVRQPDGGWAVADLGSSNGTYLNGASDPLEPHVPAPVGDGDRIHVGAWTTLLLRNTEIPISN